MKRIAAILLLLAGLSAYAQGAGAGRAGSAGAASPQAASSDRTAAVSALQKYIRQQESGGYLKGAVVGLYAADASGRAVVSHGEGLRLVPASNLKLVTTGCALTAFGEDFRFRTGLSYSGSIGPDGTLEGDVYIEGGGDPTIGSGDGISLSADALFWKWKQLLRKAGISRIHGRIIGDGSLWEGPLEHASWNYDDIGTYYGTGASALCFYRNRVDVQVAAGPLGEPVQASFTYPQLPWMHWENCSVSGPAGSGNSLYLFTTDISVNAQLRGSFALDRAPKTERFSNKYGAMTCARAFWKNLLDTGWEVSGGYADICAGSVRSSTEAVRSSTEAASGGSVAGGAVAGSGSAEGSAEDAGPAAGSAAGAATSAAGSGSAVASPSANSAAPSVEFVPGGAAASASERTSVGESVSPTLRDIVRETNVNSDNFYAEALYRAMGEAATGIALYDSCRVAQNEVILGLGLDLGGISFCDGSGLSRMNGVSARWMVAFLEKMRGDAAFVSSLPAPGEGTLVGILSSHPARSSFRMKSGSMSGVLCYSGYILDP
ncbi:MAG: D-alanyl-D-alanine carboxypeptidase, partial [Bacteroidales bacterium]|nr:D-alanyl-D-alanine carboxypeptidase [Bacteroidales bacterium]